MVFHSSTMDGDFCVCLLGLTIETTQTLIRFILFLSSLCARIITNCRDAGVDDIAH